MQAAVFLALTVVLTAPAAGQPHENDFVPGAEHILEVRRDDGKKGFAAFPAHYVGEKLTRILDPSGFRIHFTRADDPGEELIFAAGEPFVPPRGRYRYWLEGEWSITPFSTLASFGAEWPARAKSVKTLQVVPAGRVVLPAQAAAGPAHQLRLLYVGGDGRSGLRHELSRRRSTGEIGDGILMPAGPVIASLWDPHERAYAALSRPFNVQAGKTVAAPLQWPTSGKADLVVYVDRAEGVPASALPGLVLTVTQGSERRTADVTLTTSWGMYGVWYGLNHGTVTVGGANDRLYVPPAAVRLIGGRIGRYQGKLLRQILLPDAPARRP